MPTCPLQVNEVTQAVTPLLKTFFVGILQNPFAFEALQNFTTSPRTQDLLSGLRNATDSGLPELQRLLVRLCSFSIAPISLCLHALWPPAFSRFATRHLHLPSSKPKILGLHHSHFYHSC